MDKILLLVQKNILRQVFAGLTGSLTLMAAGCWLGWAAPFLHFLEKKQIPYNYTTIQSSYIVAAMDFGNLVSPIPSGYSMDKLGRKPTFIICAVIYLISWVIIIFLSYFVGCWHMNSLYVWKLIARFLGGWGRGMGYTLVPIYIAEISQNNIRGALSTTVAMLQFFGVVVDYFLGAVSSYVVMNIVSFFVPILLFILVFFIPESPHFRLMQNNPNGAYSSFCWLRNYRNTSSEQLNNEFESEFDAIKDEVQEGILSKGRWIDLVKRKGLRKASIIVNTYSMIQRLGGISNLLSFSPTTLPTRGVALRPMTFMILFGLTLALATFLCLPLVDRVGRKPLLIISSLTMAIVHGVATIFFYLCYNTQMDTTSFNWIPYVCLEVYAVGYSLGIGVIPSTLLGEMFPIDLRGKAAAVATIFYSVGSFITNSIYLEVAENIGVYLMFLLYTTVNLFSVIFTYFFLFETKHMTVLEIQAVLEGRESAIRDYDDMQRARAERTKLMFLMVP